MNRVTYDGKGSVVVAVFPEHYQGIDAVTIRFWGLAVCAALYGEYNENVALLKRMTMRAIELAHLRGASLLVIDLRYASFSTDFSIEFDRAKQKCEANGLKVIVISKDITMANSINDHAGTQHLPSRIHKLIKETDSLVVRAVFLISTLLTCYAFIRFAIAHM